jgi:hypothetical protein
MNAAKRNSDKDSDRNTLQVAIKRKISLMQNTDEYNKWNRFTYKINISQI